MTVPEGWKRQRLDRLVAKFIVPMRDKPKRFSGKTPWCRIEDIDGNTISESKLGRCVDLQTIKEMKLKVYPKGTVLCSCSCTPGICAIALNELVSNQTFIGLVPGSNMTTSSFLFYLMSSMSKQLVRSSTGTTISYIPRKRFERLEVLAPPLPEQKKIAAILSSVDETIQATGETIEQTRKVKQGLMQELLTRGIGHTSFKKTEIGEIPETWKVCKLFEIGEVSKSHGGSKKDSIEMGFPCVRYGELYTTHRTFIKQFTSYISESSRNSYTRIQLGDVLFAGSGETHEEIGMAATLLRDIEAYAGGDIILFRPSASVSYHYLGHVVNSPVVNLQKSRFGQGSSVIHLYAYQVEQLKIPIPPLDEQRQIAAVFSSVDHKIESDETLVESLQILKKGLMQDLLTGKVRVAV